MLYLFKLNCIIYIGIYIIFIYYLVLIRFFVLVYNLAGGGEKKKSRYDD